MADVFVEIDEALKQERLENLWQQYGGFFIGFLVIIVLGTAANAGYQSWNSSKNMEQTNLYLEVIDNPNFNSEDLLKISPELRDSLRGVVKIHAAGLSLKGGEKEKSLQIYNSLANSANVNITFKQLASYMAITQSIEFSAEEKLSKLEAILSDANNPWRYHAHLDSALLEANTMNDYAKARNHLAVILKDDIVPQTLKQKAQSLDILYALKEKI